MKKWIQSELKICFLMITLLTGCSLHGKYHDSIRVTYRVQKKQTAQTFASSWMSQNQAFFTDPADINGFSCIALNVSGPGLDPSESGSGSAEEVNWNAVFAGTDYCTYRGFTSNLVPNQDGAQVSVEVPAGPDRVVQVVAVPQGGSFCPTSESVADLEDRLGETEMQARFGEFYVVAQDVFDLFSDSSITLTNSYSATSPRKFSKCHSSEALEELPLVAARMGVALATWGTTSSDWGAPANFQSPVPFSGPELIDVQDANPATEVVFESNAAGNEFARMDFAFDVTGIDLTQYSNAILDLALAGGGRVATTCDGLVDTASVEARIQVDAFSWSANSFVNTTAATQTPFQYSFPDAPSTLYTAYTAGPVTEFLKVSVRSNYGSVGGAECTILKISEIRLLLQR